MGYVTSTLRRLGVREAEVLDQAQEVFLVVHARLADYDPTRPLKPWLFGIAYHHACRFRALARHRRELLDDGAGADVAADPGAGPDAALEASRRRALVLEALEGVEMSRRAVFLLMDLDGERAPEVSLALGLPLNTVYSRLRLARADFAAAVKRIEARRATNGPRPAPEGVS